MDKVDSRLIGIPGLQASYSGSAQGDQGSAIGGQLSARAIGIEDNIVIVPDLSDSHTTSSSDAGKQVKRSLHYGRGSIEGKGSGGVPAIG